MKRIIATALAAAATTAVFAAPAQAAGDPVCAVYDKIGVEHVRECGTGNS